MALLSFQMLIQSARCNATQGGQDSQEPNNAPSSAAAGGTEASRDGG